jgi:aryl-alcohol dehydrogenase-like predicted oxidoreductase
MRRRRLGSQGPEMSVIGFGAWEAGGGSEWGKAPPEDQILEAIAAIFDCGIDWIDTAEVYGNGRSEELVAKAVGGRRDEILIASKVAPSPSGSGFRPEQVRSACEGSLRRLQTDRLDLYQLHWPDEAGVPLEDTWAAMTSLVDDGLVRHIGVSNFDQPLIERCEAIRHVDSLQQEFSMLQRQDADLIRWCGERGTGVLSYGPLAFGLLTGAITPETAFDGGDFRADEDSDALFGSGFERNLAAVEHLRPIAERLGISLAQLALAWNVHQPGVTVAIAGSRNADHVRSNGAAGDVELNEATRSELDAILSETARG